MTIKISFSIKKYSVDKLAQKYMFLSQKSSIFGLNSIKLFEKTRSAQKCILTAAGAGEKRTGDGGTNPCNCFVQSTSCSSLKLQELGEIVTTFRDNI